MRTSVWVWRAAGGMWTSHVFRGKLAPQAAVTWDKVAQQETIGCTPGMWWPLSPASKQRAPARHTFSQFFRGIFVCRFLLFVLGLCCWSYCSCCCASATSGIESKILSARYQWMHDVTFSKSFGFVLCIILNFLGLLLCARVLFVLICGD